MNAVNLIPADHRRRSTSVSASPVTLGVIGSLVVVLAAAVLYVFTVNDVRERRTELARVTANAASWQAAANSYTSYVTAAAQRKQQMGDIHHLVSGRFPWSLLLSQIGGVMPANAALSNLSAASPSADSAAVAAAASGSTSSTPSANTSAVQISGCAASESAVAATMVALRRVQGVGSVNLASTSNNGTTASSSTGPNGAGGCPFPVTFQMSLELVSATPGTAAGSSTSGSAAPTAGSATPTAGSATTPAATPTASAATSSTGAAQ
jgi:Tfp pilus assembly protein PilN